MSPCGLLGANGVGVGVAFLFVFEGFGVSFEVGVEVGLELLGDFAGVFEIVEGDFANDVVGVVAGGGA